LGVPRRIFRANKKVGFRPLLTFRRSRLEITRVRRNGFVCLQILAQGGVEFNRLWRKGLKNKSKSNSNSERKVREV
jgi:hypothetical protein